MGAVANLPDSRWQTADARLMPIGEKRLISETEIGLMRHTCMKNRLKNFSVICSIARHFT